MNLADTRTEVATVVSSVNGYTVRSRPFSGAPKAGDGWVILTRLEPSDFRCSTVSLTVVLILGPDEVKAEERLENDAIAWIDALTRAENLNVADVVVEAASVLTGTNNTPLYGATIGLTTEVDPNG